MMAKSNKVWMHY